MHPFGSCGCAYPAFLSWAIPLLPLLHLWWPFYPFVSTGDLLPHSTPPTQHWTFLLLDSSPLYICKAKPPAFCGLYSVAISSRKLATGSLFKIAISPSIRVCPMPFPCSSFFLFNTSCCTVFIMNLFITVLNVWLLQLESAVEAGVLVGVCSFPDFVCS